MDVKIQNPFLEYPSNAVVNIRKIYNLDNDRMVQAVDILEDWMKKQNHFLNKNISRNYLEFTIVGCKGSVEKSKSQLDKLCTYKTLLPKYFVSSGLKSLYERLNDVVNFFVLPKMTKDYQRVYVIQFNDKQLTSTHFLEYYQAAFTIAEYLKQHDYMNGYINVIDLRKPNLVDLMTKINFIEFQQFMSILVEGFGARLQGVHLISESKMIDMVIKTIKPVLTQKIANRIHVHPQIEGFHQVVGRDILPVDFGGEERSIKELQAEWNTLLCTEKHEKFLEVMRASGTDESQRQTDKFNEQYMGLPGSFTTLTVD